MGRSYLFECAKCGYKARVSGGVDDGRLFGIQTAVCRDCRNLFDSVVRLRIPDVGLRIPSQFECFEARKMAGEPPPTFESALNRLPLLGINTFKWAHFGVRCPVSLAHRVQAWSDPGKCPRCGAFMEKNALPFRYWE